jgi:hypothetical protein
LGKSGNTGFNDALLVFSSFLQLTCLSWGFCGCDGVRTIAEYGIWKITIGEQSFEFVVIRGYFVGGGV